MSEFHDLVKSSGMKQKDVASLLDVGETTIVRWMKPQSKVPKMAVMVMRNRVDKMEKAGLL